MVICLERGADFHMAHLMPLPLTVSCFSKIQIGFTFLVPAHLSSPGKRAVKRACVCVCLSKLTDFNNFWYTEHWENFTRRPYRLIFCPHLSDVATLPREIKKVIFQYYSSYTSDYLRYFRRKQIATVVLQLLLFTYYCLVLPVISIAIILHLGHTKGGARVLIRTCCGLRQLLVATARGWISAQCGAPCDWSVSKKTGSMY